MASLVILYAQRPRSVSLFKANAMLQAPHSVIPILVRSSQTSNHEDSNYGDRATAVTLRSELAHWKMLLAKNFGLQEVAVARARYEEL